MKLLSMAFRFLMVGALFVLSLVWIYPFIWMASASVKDTFEVISKGLALFPEKLRIDNYHRAWVVGQFGVYLGNTVFVTAAVIAIVVLRCSLAGYALGRYRFKGDSLVLGLLVATFLVPTGSTIIPTVQLTMNLGLLNTHLGIIFALAGAGHVSAILLFRSYFRQIPQSLSEAAQIDGAGFLGTFLFVMLPLSGPVTATVAVLTFMFAWNSFMLPLVLTFSRPELRTLSVGMQAFSGMHENDWSGMAAAGTISLIPIVAVFLAIQQYFVDGIAGSIKE
jgi:ABC-type glycerol-3-phosphate transport system permease component